MVDIFKESTSNLVEYLDTVYTEKDVLWGIKRYLNHKGKQIIHDYTPSKKHNTKLSDQ